jgi:hypothetical protein
MLEIRVIDAVGLRLDRAHEHLAEIEFIVQNYRDSSPYTVAETFERKSQEFLYTLRCIRDPGDQIAVIVGDVMHNVRSALNYCMAGLVSPQARRSKTQFPIFTGVDPFKRVRPGGKYLEREPGRRNLWKSWMKGVDPEAVALIEGFQPYKTAWVDAPTYLGWLNAANNSDKHSKLNVLTSGVRNLTHAVVGLPSPRAVPRPDDVMFLDGTEIYRSKTKAVVEIRCIPEVAIKTGQSHLLAVGELARLLDVVRHEVIAPLTPYLRR